MSSLDDLDPSTPVLIGVGEASERIEDDDYRGLSPVELGAAAAREALADTGADPAVVAARLDVVAGTRQFETSTPVAQARLGRSDNFPRSVSARVGADPARAVLEVTGGQSPQALVTEMCRAVAAGSAHDVLLVGAEAISTTRHLAGTDDAPDFSEEVGGQLEDRGYGLRGIASVRAVAHGVRAPVVQYALFENARRTQQGRGRAEYAEQMGRLFAPFTEVAAGNPNSAAPERRTAEELATPTERNRPIADPYTRFLVARDQVNQAAAVVLTSVAVARELGVPEGRWVFLHGHADLRERDLMDREDLSHSPAAVAATRAALEQAGVGIGEVDHLDLYSCFPVAVTTITDAFGLAPDDPRGLTVTGGLPFFGGAGNNYSMHAIAEVVRRCRARRGSTGFVGANGGMLSKYSTGVYSTDPAPWREDGSAALQREIDARPAVPVSERPDGWATVETWTVTHAKDGTRGAIVVGRLETTGERFLGTGLAEDDEVLELLSGEQPAGRRVYVRTFAEGSRVTTSEARMDALRPARALGFRDSYEFVRVEREDHLLVVTIDRSDVRNALHPPAHLELEEVFDAFEADPDLWVAILTGAGTDAFCAGNDLAHTAATGETYFALSGFAGLTARHLTKPVIAAVNGYALGGGLETALACHLVVADANAALGLTEVRVGLYAAAGGVVRLPRQLPAKVATEMILTGRRMGAEEAERRGLVNRVAPAGTALEVARELAAEVLAGSPTSVAVSLQAMAEAQAYADPLDAVAARTDALDRLLTSQDTVEGLTAFAEKRAPRWVNR
ncbi:hypothetical protein GCM10011519_23330 [Marmoricola endophyticus]|uniref:enoyl-CoA hydratase n=1 Tax=Marmoricola endophyticus TaxID=2040280 RepID=A0A917F6K5_9ACTN|nr:acetyl-CoA acetyltransferase [Marmoricola endophyticus]GGF48645.1 hypothetical protein GCM10011519_23330 [Marmoricola endophyticus]